ncbi:MAG: hypothetical protein PHQ47_01975 [Candidatus Portnoybacteria bacterium]|nr:hypothetical protein [Candidatus Portnoybacteria bacterium]
MFETIQTMVQFIFEYGWLWLPVILAVVFFYSWMYYIQRVWWRGIDWILLEVKPPADIERTPKIAEQIFAGVWGIFGTVSNKYQKYVQGAIQDYFSLEIVGIDGAIHFFFRIPSRYRNLVEAQIYSQYPQTEIRQVDDYVQGVPLDIPNKNWDLWGAKLKLTKNEVYPIRTYMQQTDIIMRPTVPQFIDPLSGLMENLSKLQPGEQLWLQILMRPIQDDWVEKSAGEIKRIIEAASARMVKAAGPEGNKSSAEGISSGEKELIRGIEEKASKKAWQCKLQFAYLGRKDIFSMANVSALMGFFNQFAAVNSNNLKPDSHSTTKAFYLFAKQRKAYKQRKLFKVMKERSFWEKGYILNIEELASLFHFPSITVKAPMTPWLETRKGGPPIDLPT